MTTRTTVLLIGVSLLLGTTATAAEPTLILHNGKIVTVDAKFSTAEALAVDGERIVAVGSNADIRKLAGPNTQQIDLSGKTVIPGLIDSHVHPVGAALYEFDHPIPEMETVADVLKYIAGRAEFLDDGEWILVRQVFITRLRDQRYPTRAELDRVAPKNPVLFSTGPDASVNSLALELSGIDEDFQMPAGGQGYLERDPKTGKLTGILRSCTRLVKHKSPEKSASADERRQRLKTLFADYNAVGITSISDRSASDSSVKLYQELRDADELTCRVYCYLNVSPNAPLDDLQARLQRAAEHPLHTYDNRLWLRGIKIFLDGGMLTGSAYMTRPWGVSEIYSITDPNYRGLLYVEPERLETIARLCMQHELQMTAHSVGDGAVETLVAAYAAVAEKDGFDLHKTRPCVTHCNFMSREAIDLMRQHGIVADLQPAWLYLDGATLEKQFGEERLTYFQPYKTLFDEGVIIGGGSDHMQKVGSLRSVNPYNPFWGMWVTLTRQPRWTDDPLRPEQKITREQALRLYTINNAYLTFEEQEKGSLEPGKLADFAVLDRDLLTCPLEDLKDTQVEQTWLGGKLIYQRGE